MRFFSKKHMDYVKTRPCFLTRYLLTNSTIDYKGKGKGAPAPVPSPPSKGKGYDFSKGKGASTDMAQCSAHSECAHLNGDCCPTKSGFYLQWYV